ncbi:hypothetical protein [Algoriphagus aquimarinus]|uniref:hypothetical protein n=1 Tax=Algoriphagus aquimarinus TaxID=237018 RepID=UPI0030DCA3B2|tara:strand:- start:716 stop:1009 length:294 start_codon:yes stop_codon:yes gene_type:complete
MKKVLIIFYVAFLGLVSCADDKDPVTLDPTRPTGSFSVARSGNFLDQNSAGSMGVAGIGTDTQGKEILQFSSDFNTAQRVFNFYLQLKMQEILNSML